MAKNIFRYFGINMTNGYYLISKINNLPYFKYKGDALKLVNQSAKTVDEIIAGKTDNPNIIRKITTFKDSDGNIIERVFNYSDKAFRNRIYKRRDNVIGNDEYVISTHIKEYTMLRVLEKDYKKMINDGHRRTIFWSPVKFFTNHFSQNINTGEKILTQVFQTNLTHPQKEKHTFIEFPHIMNNKILKTSKKILKFTVNTLNNHKVLNKGIIEKGVKLPLQDSYLGLRALDIEDSKLAFAQKFLSERKLAGKKIIINPEYLPQNNYEEMAKALFKPFDGTLNFNKGYVFKDKSEVVSTARHEVEHGWQFYLHARNTKGGAYEWEERIYNEFKDLPKSLRAEAKKYTESINSYVTIAQDRTKYRQNYIEQKANEKGLKAKVLYDYESKELSMQFQHIPKSLL